jgi:murein L,D-transpeptidase YcbB/YkuD
MHRTPARLAAASAWLLLGLDAAAQSAAPASVPAAAPASATAAVAADPVAEAIRERVDHLRYELQHDHRNHAVRGERIVLGDTVARYYESQQFQPKWRDPARLRQLLESLRELHNDGLDPAEYHFAALDTFRAELGRGKALPDGEQAALEILATDALMLGLSHLYLGRVDPAQLSPQWNFPSKPVDVERGFEALTRALESGAIRATFERARPQHVWYQRGRERLREHRALAAAGGWPTVPAGPTLKPGMSDARVPVLRARLRVTRDFPAAGAAAAAGMPGAPATVAAAPAAAGPAPAEPPPDELYDAPLEAAVRAFQQRHGLTPDGAVGPATIAALNVPVEQRIDQIRINLERARWVLHELRGEFVLVDVAGFDVSYFREDEPVWTSKVIVGRPYRETPIFKSLITYVVINPTWTIPPGILVKDKLPVIKRDPGYLKRNNIRVIDSRGREVNPYSVNWSRYGAGNLPPYQLRQDPGEDNALGLVKIMFPNPYLVYLHDTPSKSLFDRDQRTFSSGCIRVQRAFELAELVLGDPARWNQETLAAAVATGKMQTVNLAKPVPVLLLYWTAQPLANGQVVFRNDVYGRDPPTLAALDGPFRPRR